MVGVAQGKQREWQILIRRIALHRILQLPARDVAGATLVEMREHLATVPRGIPRCQPLIEEGSEVPRRQLVGRKKRANPWVLWHALCRFVSSGRHGAPFVVVVVVVVVVEVGWVPLPLPPSEQGILVGAIPARSLRPPEGLPPLPRARAYASFNLSRSHIPILRAIHSTHRGREAIGCTAADRAIACILDTR